MPGPADLVTALRCAPTGETLQAAWRMLRKAAVDVTRDNRIPRPGGGPWSAEDLDDLVQEVFASGRFDKLVLSSSDDAHFRARSTVAIKHMIIDQLRESGQSALRERVVDVLNRGDFVSVGDAYGLADHNPEDRYQAASAPLHQAAQRTPARVQPFNPNAERASSFAPRSDLEAVLTAVLQAAGAPVATTTLVQIVGYRVAVGRIPDIPDADPVVPSVTPEQTTIGNSTAYAIWEQLTPTQRRVVPLMDNSAREAAKEIGLGKTVIAEAMSGVRTVAQAHGADLDDDTQREVMRELLQLCEGGHHDEMSRDTSQEPPQ